MKPEGWADKKSSIINTMALHGMIGEPISAPIVFACLMTSMHCSDARFSSLGATLSMRHQCSSLLDGRLDFDTCAASTGNNLSTVVATIDDAVSNWKEWSKTATPHFGGITLTSEEEEFAGAALTRNGGRRNG